MQLTEQQQRDLENIRVVYRSTSKLKQSVFGELLDIIDTLQQSDPLASDTSDSSHDGYEWREHPMEPSGKHGDWRKKGVGG